MKTMRSLLLVVAILSIACISCSKFENDEPVIQDEKATPANPYVLDDNGGVYPANTWIEYFSNSTSLNTNWVLFGKPLPKWVYASYGKQGLFDNNGPSPTKNYAVSNRKIGKDKGYILEGELMLQIINYYGSCVCPGIAVSRDLKPLINANNEVPVSTSFKLVFAGYNATWFPKAIKGHTWFVMEYLSEGGTVVNSGFIQADEYSNSWHTLKIEVTEARYVRFYCDDKLLWSPLPRLDPEMMSDKRIILGYTSDGDTKTYAGVAYHNWIKSTFTVGPER